MISKMIVNFFYKKDKKRTFFLDTLFIFFNYTQYNILYSQFYIYKIMIINYL